MDREQVIATLRAHEPELKAIGVLSASVFGSVARDEAGPEADVDAARAIEGFAEERLGKTVVRAADRPGFIANRIGAYWLLSAITLALELDLTVEEADLVAAAAFGVPKSGVFGLLDLVGLDLVSRVAASLRAQLPADDPFRALPAEPALLGRMIAEGRTGRKGQGGFYRLSERNGERVNPLSVRFASVQVADTGLANAVKARLKALLSVGVRKG